MSTQWAWLLGLIVGVILLFVFLFRFSSDIEPDENKKDDGEKWWDGRG